MACKPPPDPRALVSKNESWTVPNAYVHSSRLAPAIVKVIGKGKWLLQGQQHRVSGVARVVMEKVAKRFLQMEVLPKVRVMAVIVQTLAMCSMC